ncbi:MAG: hypothetical protein AAFQ66_06180, partial [Pseudomonadota bacterium]
MKDDHNISVQSDLPLRKRFILSGLRLPTVSSLRRRSIIPVSNRRPDFSSRYDFHTIAYDCIHLPKWNAVVLICPKLLNLEQPLRKAQFLIDGAEVRLKKVKRFKRYDEIWLRCRAPFPDELECRLDATVLTAPIAKPCDEFSGRRVLCTKSRNNRLEWIYDWVDHHVRNQGTDSVLLFDNGSDAYTTDDLEAALCQVTGLRQVVIVAAPFPFGAMGLKKPRNKALFLQTGLLNLARYRFLHCARSTIHCDIDELAFSDGATLHEKAEASLFGYVTAKVVWRHLPKDHTGPIDHSSHTMRRSRETQTKEKWCISINFLNRFFSHDVHGIGGYLFNRIINIRSSRFLHCYSISTNWKSVRKNQIWDLVPALDGSLGNR